MIQADIAVVGGEIFTMSDLGTIPEGVVLLKGNRILAVGTADEVGAFDDTSSVDVQTGDHSGG